jgi:hypothetical protein
MTGVQRTVEDARKWTERMAKECEVLARTPRKAGEAAARAAKHLAYIQKLLGRAENKRPYTAEEYRKQILTFIGTTHPAAKTLIKDETSSPPAKP